MNPTQIEIAEIELIAQEIAKKEAELAARELNDSDLLFVGGGTGNVIF